MRMLSASFLAVLFCVALPVGSVAAQAQGAAASPVAAEADDGIAEGQQGERRSVDGPDVASPPSVAAEAGATVAAESDTAGAEVGDGTAAAEETEKSEQAEPDADTADRDAFDDAALLRQRVSLARTHRLLGIATWGAMTATVVLGAIQYYNLYGFFSSLEATPCVQGSAVFGQGQCSGIPWLHLGSSLLTAGLYTATGLLAWRMPVPEGYAQGRGRHARNVRLHRLLRWIHLGGMVAQMLLGYVTANAQQFGLDRANDYGTLQALATVHQGIGLVTWGALTWAGWLFL